jgi:hypothetical protein
VLYARQPHNGLYWRCRIDQRQCAARVLFGKPPPQLDRLHAAEDVQRMTRMDANKQIACKFGYRESAALNQQTVAAPRRFSRLVNATAIGIGH